MNFYNEIDPFAAQWLRNLIAEGHIANGVVDERDIREIEAYELAKFTQCHFFAGIGVWPYALRKSGWSDDEPLWSGSCPCPPFSQAGRGQTCPACGSGRNICHPRKTGHFICLDCGCDRHADDRHLWPEFARLIRDGKPPKIIGEQVASKDGRIWLGAVSADLQTMGYAVAGADICAAGFGGAHIRQRNYFVGLADSDEQQRDGCGNAGPGGRGEFADIGSISRMADRDDTGSQGWRERRDSPDERSAWSGGMVGGLAHSNGDGRDSTGKSGREQSERDTQPGGTISGLADAEHGGRRTDEPQRQTEKRTVDGRNREGIGGNGAPSDAPLCGRNIADWLYCRDEKWRPVEPFSFPLVNAAPARVGRLRAYGNALDAETAIQFCGAVREIVLGV